MRRILGHIQAKRSVAVRTMILPVGDFFAVLTAAMRTLRAHDLIAIQGKLVAVEVFQKLVCLVHDNGLVSRAEFRVAARFIVQIATLFKATCQGLAARSAGRFAHRRAVALVLRIDRPFQKFIFAQFHRFKRSVYIISTLWIEERFSLLFDIVFSSFPAGSRARLKLFAVGKNANSLPATADATAGDFHFKIADFHALTTRA